MSVRLLRSWARLALVLFVATSVLPRASMYAHHHDGGDHAHVHPWGEDAVVEHHHHHDHDDADLDDDDDEGDHDDEHRHHHHHLDAADADAGPGLTDPDGDHGTHVHWQSPFQHATRVEAPRIVDATLVRSHDAPLHLAAGRELHRSASARAPPPPSAA